MFQKQTDGIRVTLPSRVVDRAHAGALHEDKLGQDGGGGLERATT